LVRREPISDAHAMLLYALDPPDSCRKIGAQKPAVGSFVRQSPNRGKAQVDLGRGIFGLFEIDPVACHHSLVERKVRFEAVPIDKFTNRMIAGPLRAAGVRLLRTADFDGSRSGSFRIVLGVSLLVLLAIPAVCTTPRSRQTRPEQAERVYRDL